MNPAIEERAIEPSLGYYDGAEEDDGEVQGKGMRLGWKSARLKTRGRGTCASSSAYI